MIKTFVLSFAIFLLVEIPALGQEQNTQESQNLTPEHYEIQLKLLTTKADLEARTRMTVRNTGLTTLETLVLYLHDELQLDSVETEDGKKVLNIQQRIIESPCSITKKIREIRIGYDLPPGGSAALTLVYNGTVRGTDIRSKSDAFFKIKPNSVFLRSAGYTNWFPVTHNGFEILNDQAMFDLVYNVPARFKGKAIAFGTLLSEKVENGRYISQWKTDTPQVVLLPELWAFTGWIKRQSGNFLLYHLDNEQSRKAADVYQLVGSKLLDFYQNHYGSDHTKAPTFHLAELDVPSGGYPSVNTLGLSQSDFRDVLNQKRRYTTLEWFAHELVHEYLLVQTDTKAPGAAVISEGFYLFFHLPALVHVLNQLGLDPEVTLFKPGEGDRFKTWDIRSKWKQYEEGLKTGRDRRGKLPPHKPLADITTEEYPHYKDRWLTADKEQIILYRLQDMLDDAAGEGTFLKAYGQYLYDHHTQPATLVNFREYMERASGLDLRGFFQRWFHTEQQLPEEWKSF